MGLNTVVVVLNDALHQIETDAEFGHRLAHAIMLRAGPDRHHNWVSAGNHVNAAEVISMAHADYYQTVAVGGNTGWNLSDDDVPDRVLEAAADKLRMKGWRVSKPPKVRKSAV